MYTLLRIKLWNGLLAKRAPILSFVPGYCNKS